MKNFKLLLATTAILSTTIMAANVWADGEAPANPTATIKAHVGLYEANKITVLRDLEFGTLLDTGRTGEEVIARLDPTPSVDDLIITGPGVEKAGDDYHNAYIAVTVPAGYTASLSLPVGSIILYDDYGRTAYLRPESSMEYYETRGPIRLDYYFVGGEIVLTNADFTGDYNGSFTVTAVLTPDTNPSSGN